MIFLTLFIICINIISVLCVMPSDIEECGSVMKFFDNYLQTSGHTLKIPVCCDESNKYHHIYCKNGHISEIQLRYNNKEENMDFSNFPVLPNLEYFLVEGHIFKDGVLPSKLFEMKSLKSLKILSANLLKVPENIDSCDLEELSIYNNSISGFPNSFMKCTNLKHLDLSRNQEIGSIPDSISSLKNLNNLYLGMTGLNSLSEEVFKLNINNFDIAGNPSLSTKIFNFGKKVEKCDFRNTNIICYEPDTCNSFVVQDKPRVYNNDTNSVYEKCESTLVKSNSFSNKKLWLILIPLFLVILLLIILILFCCRRRQQKDNKEVEKSSTEIKEENIYIPPIAPVTDISTTFIHDIDPSKTSKEKSSSNNISTMNNISNVNTIDNSSSNINLNNLNSSINGISIIPVTNISTDRITSPTTPLSGIEICTSSAPPSADINLSPIPNASDNCNSFSFVDSTIDNINSIHPITSLPSFNEPLYQSTRQYENIPATSPTSIKLDTPTVTTPSQSSIICHPSTSNGTYELTPSYPSPSYSGPSYTTHSYTTHSYTTQSYTSHSYTSPSYIKNAFSIGYDNELNNNVSLYYSDMMEIPDIAKPASQQNSSIRPIKSTSHIYSNIPSSED